MRRDTVKEVERDVQVCAAAFRLEKENLADDTKHVTAAFAGRDEFLDFVGEENQPDLVIVANGREGEDGSDFGGEFALRLFARAEQAGAADVDEKHDCEL